MDKGLKQGMFLPPFMRIVGKFLNGPQTQLMFTATNYASSNDFLAKPPPPQLSISDVKRQVIPSAESFTFIRAINDKADAICQTLRDKEKANGERTDNECQTITLEGEETPLAAAR